MHVVSIWQILSLILRDLYIYEKDLFVGTQMVSTLHAQCHVAAFVPAACLAHAFLGKEIIVPVGWPINNAIIVIVSGVCSTKVDTIRITCAALG